MLLIRNNGHTNFISDNTTKATFPYPNRKEEHNREVKHENHEKNGDRDHDQHGGRDIGISHRRWLCQRTGDDAVLFQLGLCERLLRDRRHLHRISGADLCGRLLYWTHPQRSGHQGPLRGGRRQGRGQAPQLLCVGL